MSHRPEGPPSQLWRGYQVAWPVCASVPFDLPALYVRSLGPPKLRAGAGAAVVLAQAHKKASEQKTVVCTLEPLLNAPIFCAGTVLTWPSQLQANCYRGKYGCVLSRAPAVLALRAALALRPPVYVPAARGPTNTRVTFLRSVWPDQQRQSAT